jgi:hypothetical protein
MTRTIYVNEYALNVCTDRKGKPYLSIGGSDEVPEELADGLTDRAAMVFDGEVIDVRGWNAEKRAAADIHDTACDEYWRGSFRPATPAEVLAIFFPDAAVDGVPAGEAGTTDGICAECGGTCIAGVASHRVGCARSVVHIVTATPGVRIPTRAEVEQAMARLEDCAYRDGAHGFTDETPMLVECRTKLLSLIPTRDANSSPAGEPTTEQRTDDA